MTTLLVWLGVIVALSMATGFFLAKCTAPTGTDTLT